MQNSKNSALRLNDSQHLVLDLDTIVVTRTHLDEFTETFWGYSINNPQKRLVVVFDLIDNLSVIKTN